VSLAPPELAALAAIVALAFGVEAATGFGSTVVALTLGAGHFGLEPLLGVLVPLNLLLSAWILARERSEVSRAFLLQRALPAMGAGLVLGTALCSALPARALAAGFGLFVAALAIAQLVSIARPPRPLAPGAQWAALLAGGVAHGLFATGGPLAVVVAQRALPQKAAFRATLACLWLVLNLGVLARLGWSGHLGGASLVTSALLLLPLGLGAVAGDRLHRVLGRSAFRAVVAVVLLLGGASLFWGSR